VEDFPERVAEDSVAGRLVFATGVSRLV